MGYTFSARDAARIASATRAYESGRGTNGIPDQSHRSRPDGLTFVIGKTSAAWTKGTTATINIHAKNNLSATGDTVQATNLFADIEADKWVAILDGFLISAEC